MHLHELFPEVLINHEASMGQGWVTFHQENQYFHFPLETLSQRERVLLELLNPSEEVGASDEDVWFQYLVQKKGQLPQKLEAVQLLYIEHFYRMSSDLLELFQELLPNIIAVVEISMTQTVLVLDQTPYFEVKDLVQDILPTVESDFGTKLTIFFGNVWTRLQNEEVHLFFESEYQLFSDFVRLKGDQQIIVFTQMILWAQSRHLDFGIIPDKICQYIDESKDIADIIETMWDSQGNLVQTAQKLFMHRNSLQYKLEKFYTLSGLNLKNLDDLAFCHLLLLNV